MFNPSATQQMTNQMSGAIVFLGLAKYTFLFVMFLMYFHPACQYILELARIPFNAG